MKNDSKRMKGNSGAAGWHIYLLIYNPDPDIMDRGKPHRIWKNGFKQ